MSTISITRKRVCETVGDVIMCGAACGCVVTVMSRGTQICLRSLMSSLIVIQGDERRNTLDFCDVSRYNYLGLQILAHHFMARRVGVRDVLENTCSVISYIQILETISFAKIDSKHYLPMLNCQACACVIVTGIFVYRYQRCPQTDRCWSLAQPRSWL